VNRHLPLDRRPDGTWTATDDACVLNDDCAVGLGWLATLWEELESRPDCWFAGPSGPCRTAPQCTGGKGDERPPQVVSHVAGFCLVMKREALQALGPLDEAFRHYGSDVDMQWRAQRDHGKRSLWVPSVFVDRGLHAPHEPWYTMDNVEFWKRWGGKWSRSP